MNSSDARRSVEYYDALAPRYDAELTATSSDRLARTAFVDLVSACVSEGATILDFGSGTGLDAATYVGRGYRVLAYDTSPGMMAHLQRRCGTDIDAGRVLPFAGAYETLSARIPDWPAPCAIVSNFAVINMIENLPPLLEDFASWLAPPGWLIISLINPMGWRDMSSMWWWRHLLRRGQTEPVPYLTDKIASYLHFLPGVLGPASKFHLVGIANAGTLVRYRDVPNGGVARTWVPPEPVGRLKTALWQTSLSRFLGRFVFLVLRRDP